MSGQAMPGYTGIAHHKAPTMMVHLSIAIIPSKTGDLVGVGAATSRRGVHGGQILTQNAKDLFYTEKNPPVLLLAAALRILPT